MRSKASIRVLWQFSSQRKKLFEMEVWFTSAVELLSVVQYMCLDYLFCRHLCVPRALGSASWLKERDIHMCNALVSNLPPYGFLRHVILSVNKMQFFHSTSYFVDLTIILSNRITSATWQLFNAYAWIDKCRVHTPRNTTCPVLKRIFPLVSSRQLIGRDWSAHVIDNNHRVSEYGNFPHNTFISVYLHYSCREVSCKPETV